jgi:hypothetical protein
MKILIIFLLTASTVMAMPKKLEVWFLSVDKTAFLDPILKKKKFSKQIATNYQCQPMGDYCFDPQIGLYKKDKNKVVAISDYTSLDTEDKKVKDGSYSEGVYDPCKKPGHFNLFCKNRKVKKKKVIKPSQKLELWVDISTTMKQVDFNGYGEGASSECRRETFLKRINKTCPLNKKMKVYIFDENRKELGNFDRVCISSGLNRLDRLIRDIKASNAKNLIIITDIYEAKASFIDFIEGEGLGIVKGINTPLYAKDILKDVSRIQKMCQ